MSNDVAGWLARAMADADARNLPELKPLLESLSRSLQALRAADAEFRHPAIADIPPPHAGTLPRRDPGSPSDDSST